MAQDQHTDFSLLPYQEKANRYFGINTWRPHRIVYTLASPIFQRS